MFSHKKKVEDIKNHCLISGCSLFDRITITRNKDIFPLLSTNKRTNNSSFHMQVISKNEENMKSIYYYILFLMSSYGINFHYRISLKISHQFRVIIEGCEFLSWFIFRKHLEFKRKEKGCKN